MKKELFQEIEIPEGMEINIDGSEVIVKGKEGELKRTFGQNKLAFEKKENKIIIGHKKATKQEKKLMNTIAAHIKNMIKGVDEKFEYKVKICFSHFPMTVEVEGNKATIKNFLGEKIPRIAKIPEGVEVKADKEFITITSNNKELAGQTAANFEKATRITSRDRRVFQDGLFIINKAGREM
jgi:large subunit ribosomal protein L6